METMKYRCPACLTEFNQGTSCPSCGFDGSQRSQMPYIRIGEILRARYRIGQWVQSNGESVTYRAFDREQKRAVYVQEYFPQDVCGRMDDGLTLTISEQGENIFLRGIKPYRNLMEALKADGCDGILEIQEVFTENKTVYTVTRGINSSTLAELMRQKENPLSWNQVSRIFRPVLDALIVLHQHGIGHYGMAPENLYLSSDGRMRLGGFATEAVRKSGNGKATELYAGFSAPEQYEPEASLTEATDVYAMCACMLYTVTGMIPKSAAQRKEDPQLILPESMADTIPPFVITALGHGLQVQPERRTATLEQLRSELYTDASQPTAVAVVPIAAINEENVEELNVQMPEKTKSAAKKVKHYRVPNFLAGLIAFLVTGAILFHVCINYILNDPDYPYLDIGIFGPGASSQTPSVPSNPSSVPSNPSSNPSAKPEDNIPEGAVAVPNFVGKDLETAQKNKDFKILLAKKEFSDEYDEGMIIEQNITGYAQPGSYIAVTVSLGEQKRTLPKVAGKSFDEARKALEKAGFRVGTVTKEQNDSYADNTVIRIDGDLKAGSKYDYGTPVDLIVSYR